MKDVARQIVDDYIQKEKRIMLVLLTILCYGLLALVCFL